MMNRHALLLVTLGALPLGGACDRDIFDVSVNLAPHAYQADFGAATGTIPTVTCSPDMISLCAGQTVVATTNVGPADVSVDPGCDPTTILCYAEAHARLTYEVDVLQDDDFVTKVAQHSAWIVQDVDLAYTVPTNTLTFAIPRIDVYVGPTGTKTESDPGAVLVDSVTTLAAGTTFVDQPRHLMVADGSPARALIVSSIEAKQAFAFVVVMAPRLEAGAPVPAGRVELDIAPTIGLGLE
jgi:hypothetical protein